MKKECKIFVQRISFFIKLFKIKNKFIYIKNISILFIKAYIIYKDPYYFISNKKFCGMSSKIKRFLIVYINITIIINMNNYNYYFLK